MTFFICFPALRRRRCLCRYFGRYFDRQSPWPPWRDEPCSESRVLAARDQVGIVGKDADQRLDPGLLALGEIAQHVMLHHVLVTGMTNADAHPPVIVADMLGDRPQPVMAGNAAAGLHANFGGRQIDLVVKHGDGVERQLVEMRGFRDRATRIHSCMCRATTTARARRRSAPRRQRLESAGATARCRGAWRSLVAP